MTAIRSVGVVDVFCGIGGLSHGFVQEGFRVIAGIDADPTCQHAYESNNRASFYAQNVEDLPSADLLKLFADTKIRVLVGCAPCQPFSSYVPSSKKPRQWALLDEFARLIRECEPHVISMENVARLRSFSNGSVWRNFLSELDGYNYQVQSVNCVDFGVPQTRRRLVLLASRLGPIELMKPNTPQRRTVRDAIAKLPAICHGEASALDLAHSSQRLSSLNIKRIRASLPGGSWHDWPEELVADCHRRETGKTYRNVYGRLDWDLPAPTITSGCFNYGRGRFGHPEQDRALSLREAALLQGFPSEYCLLDPKLPFSFARIGRHVANAVPVPLSRAIARSILTHLSEVCHG